MSARDETLVTLKTRVSNAVAAELVELADKADRSLAAELRQAIQNHLSDARKDGRTK